MNSVVVVNMPSNARRVIPLLCSFIAIGLTSTAWGIVNGQIETFSVDDGGWTGFPAGGRILSGSPSGLGDAYLQAQADAPGAPLFVRSSR
jgi:hypothetical protein